MKQVPERKLEFVGIDDIDLGDSPAAAARNRSRYAQLGATGYDSVLHVSMVYWFDVDGTISPSVTLRATIDATLFLTGSNTEAYRRSWHYFSEPKNYFDLAADDARRLRQEFQDAYTGIAEKVVNDIFVAEMPEDEANTNTGRVRTIQVGEPAP
jgi:hypothetical protein